MITKQINVKVNATDVAINLTSGIAHVDLTITFDRKGLFQREIKRQFTIGPTALAQLNTLVDNEITDMLNNP
jgi:hypothetical protein